MRRHYYVYILTNHTGTLYTGMTNNLMRRHVRDAIAREKEIKAWRREK